VNMTSESLRIESHLDMEVPVSAPGEFAVSLLFFISGAAGLIFEVAWFHRCGLVFGNSIWSTSIVLSSFMGGLALGNGLVGRFGHRIGRFLRAYAALEATVGVTGIALTAGLPALTGYLAPATRGILDVPWLIDPVRLVTAFALLIVPATAMGATLPVLVGALCRWRPGFGRVLGRLYGWNTLGAVTGVACSELVLIGRFGVMGSAWIAGSLDLVAAGAALWISRNAGESRLIADPSAPEPLRIQTGTWRLLSCAFLSGGCLLALEVVWFRFLSMFVITSTLAVSLMLAVVLAAIGLGGLAASYWLKRRPGDAAYLPAAALGAACALVASYVSFQFVARGPWAVQWYRILWFACALTFLTSLLSGVIFTLLGEALKRNFFAAARAAGWLTLANTSGAMCGSLLAAFVLLPLLGMERAIFALAALYVVIGLLAARDVLPGLSTNPGKAFVAAGLGSVAALALFPFGLMNGKYFRRAAGAYISDGSQIIATREGSAETIFLTRKTWLGKPVSHRLITNGFSMSGTNLASLRYMREFVYLPMLLHQEPLRHALVLCYGVGVTAGAVTDLASVESIDVVETSRDVVAMSDLIYPPDKSPLRDPRVRLHLEDGRYFLQATGERFDLITGEPPPLLTSGTVNLYTREYFQLVHDRLAAGGITTYWLPAARWGQYDVKSIIRAFCDVFEDCSLWSGTPSDWILVGTRGRSNRAPYEHWSDAWNQPVLGNHLREIGFEQPEQLGATFLGGAEYLRKLTAGTPPLTDDFPQRLLPPSTGFSLSSRSNTFYHDTGEFSIKVTDTNRAREAAETSKFARGLWSDDMLKRTLPFFFQQRIINRLLSEGADPLRHIEELHSLLTETSFHSLPLWELGSDDVLQRIAATGNDGTGAVEYVLAVGALASRDYSAAAADFAESERRGFRIVTLQPLRAYALCMAGQPASARKLADDASLRNPDEVHFWTWMESKFGVGPDD
jgi:spermidine synthase